MTDAEVVTLAVAQEMLGIDHDAEFLTLARRLLGHLFPKLPQQPGYWKRRQRLSDTIEWLIGVFAAESPGFRDNVVLLDSTPVECGRSVETARRSQLATPAASAPRDRFILCALRLARPLNRPGARPDGLRPCVQNAGIPWPWLASREHLELTAPSGESRRTGVRP